MKRFVLAICIMLSAGICRAGDERGNGGGGLVCSNVSPVQVLLLDLWEAEALLKWPLMRSSEPVTQQASQAILRLQGLNSSTYTQVMSNAWTILNMIDDGSAFLASGISISPPTDAKNVFFPTNCPLSGVAIYDDKIDRVFIDKSLYNLMSETDKAALVVHEAVYKLMRNWYDTQDSIGARKLVGCLFKQTACVDLDPMWRTQNSGTILKCKGGDSEFSIYAYGANQTRFQYTQFNGFPVIGETIATTVSSIFKYSSIKLKSGIAKITMTADHTELVDLVSDYGVKKTLLIGGKSGSALTVNNEKLECTY